MTGRVVLKTAAMLGVSLGALLAGSARAQTAPPIAAQTTGQPAAQAASGGASGTQVDEVIVTATKRAENIQDVPVAVQAIGGQEVQRLNLTSLADLTKISPSFNFFENSTPRTQATFIRGIGTYTTSDAIEPSVGIVIDGVALARQGMAFVDPFDVSQIEVLRGPQGTLFGKNASAGVVNITTQAPSDTFQAAGRALFGNRSEQQFGVSVAGPLAPNLTSRFTGYYNTRDGDITDTFLKRKINDLNNFGFRGKLRYDAGFADFTLIADYNRAYADCCAWSAFSDGAPASPTYQGLLAAFGLTASRNNYNVAANVLPLSASDSGGVSLTAHAHRYGEDFTSITAYRYWQTHEISDVDQLPVSLLNSFNRTRQQQFSQEFRVANPSGSALDHTFGLYFFHYDIRGSAALDFPASGALFGPLGDVTANGRSTLTYDNGAIFGEGTYHFPDGKTQLRAGGRFTVESVATTLDRTDNVTFIPGFNAYKEADSNINTGFSGVLALQHRFSEELMSYVQVSRGFKGAAYDLPGATDPQPVDLAKNRVQPENAMNYEGGIRSQLFDRRLTLNATLFYETIDNYQATTYDAKANVFHIQNVGSLASRGVELEANWRPTSALVIGGGVTYDDAIYDDFKHGQCQYTAFTAGKCTQPTPGAFEIDLSGKQLFAAPKWTYVIDAQYTWRDLPLPIDLYARANYAYRSHTVAEPSLDAVNFEESYGLFDARLGATSKDGRYEIALYGKNLTDETYEQAHFFAPLFGGIAAKSSATAAFFGLRRSYGVEVIAHF